MLTFLFNRYNTISDHGPEEIARAGLTCVGFSADVPEAMAADMAKAAGSVALYDSELPFTADPADAFRRAKALGAKSVVFSVGSACDAGSDETKYRGALSELAEKCAKENLHLLLTNRRPFLRGVPVSAKKLGRLCEACHVRLAYDVGSAHAYTHGLEDYFDLHEWIDVLFLNDNHGREALCGVGHEDYEPGISPDDMRQPGYGSAPFVALMESVSELLPNADLFINGGRFQNADLETVLLETRTLLAGRVFINPAGGKFGMGSDGRLLI